MQWIRQIVKWFLLVLLQVLIFNNLHLFGLCHPFIFILFLLEMPLLPRWAEMLVGAVTGLMMDIFCNSPGVHMAACTAVCYLRPLLLPRLVQNAERITDKVTPLSIGLNEYLRMICIMVPLYHVLVFVLEAWSLHHFGSLLTQILLSALISLLLMIGYALCRR